MGVQKQIWYADVERAARWKTRTHVVQLARVAAAQDLGA